MKFGRIGVVAPITSEFSTTSAEAIVPSHGAQMTKALADDFARFRAFQGCARGDKMLLRQAVQVSARLVWKGRDGCRSTPIRVTAIR